jgi:hypothetical protein
MTQSIAAPRQVPAAGRDAAVAALIEIGQLMNELCEIVEAETELVRSGRLTAAVEIASRKAELARLFMSCVSRLRAGGPDLKPMPKLLEQLRRQHEQFRVALQINLTVLTTARAVSEGILRGVSNELARRSTVQTYGASGRPHKPSQRTGPPIALNRSL